MKKRQQIKIKEFVLLDQSGAAEYTQVKNKVNSKSTPAATDPLIMASKP